MHSDFSYFASATTSGCVWTRQGKSIFLLQPQNEINPHYTIYRMHRSKQGHAGVAEKHLVQKNAFSAVAKWVGDNHCGATQHHKHTHTHMCCVCLSSRAGTLCNDYSECPIEQDCFRHVVQIGNVVMRAISGRKRHSSQDTWLSSRETLANEWLITNPGQLVNTYKEAQNYFRSATGYN